MKIILTVILAVLFTLCFAPYHQFELGFISISGLLLILDKLSSNKKVFWYGVLFGFVHHITGLYWISYSMLVEPDKFAWMIPFAISIIPFYLSLYIGFVCWLTYKFRLNFILKTVFFSAAWTLAEIARGYALTGFPWNLVGYSFLFNENISQLGSIIGVYGLSLCAMLFFTSPYLAIYYIFKSKFSFTYRTCFSLYFIMPTILVLTLLYNWGGERIAANKDKFAKTKIRIVQPNIAQADKFNPDLKEEQLFKYYTLSLKESKLLDFVPNLVIWPEVATQINVAEDKEFLREIADIIPTGAYLILGTIRQEGWVLHSKFFNSVQLVNSEGTLQKIHYDKFHLVPFGEYVPLREFLPGIEKIAKGVGDFDKGNSPKTLKISNFPPFSPLICYEIIFPGEVIDKDSKPEWILNLTNDAWFGNSSGPQQHLDTVRMRAIEEGLPVIRSANTGISAVVDGYGRVLESLKLEKMGVIDSKLPIKLEKTYFSQVGNIFVIKISLILMAVSLFLRGVFKLQILLRSKKGT